MGEERSAGSPGIHRVHQKPKKTCVNSPKAPRELLSIPHMVVVSTQLLGSPCTISPLQREAGEP